MNLKNCILFILVCFVIQTALGEEFVDLANEGTLQFEFQLKQDLTNGINGTNLKELSLLRMDGVAKIIIKDDTGCSVVRWLWDSKNSLVKNNLRVNMPLPELKGDEWHHLFFSWNTKANIFDSYLNGSPMRIPKTFISKFVVPHERMKVHKGEEYVEIRNLSHSSKYIEPKKVASHVPRESKHKTASMLGHVPLDKPMSIDKGELLYQNKFENYWDTTGWLAEGPARTIHEDGWMRMSSHVPTRSGPKGGYGHIVYWCPKVFPESFLAEWEVQFMKEDGLAIVFFCAQGGNGEDIFHPSLKPRNGIFTQYINSDLDSYHISYYANNPTLAPGRVTSHLRKNSGFYLVSNGPNVIPAGSTKIHKAQLIKQGNHIQMSIDGVTIIDFIDDGKQYGPVHSNGRIGFRQMCWTDARYRNFKVWALK